jgi:hypothetical protein
MAHKLKNFNINNFFLFFIRSFIIIGKKKLIKKEKKLKKEKFVFF